MGGYGSDRWGGHRRRACITERLALDLRALRRAGLFEHAGERGRFKWENGHAVAWALDLDGDTGALRLSYGLQHEGGEVERQRETVRLERRAIAYHGYCWYLCCPRCGRRCKVLYLIGARWMCRVCGRLSYPSQLYHDKTRDKWRRMWEANPEGLLLALVAGNADATRYVLTEHGQERGYGP